MNIQNLLEGHLPEAVKFLIIFMLISSFTYGQFFEGKIVYEHTYKSKLPNVTDQQFSAMMGTTQEYLAKGGNYKSITNGSLLQWQLYRQSDNKLYTKMANNPAILWKDAAVNADEVIKMQVNKNVIEILGHRCDELVLTSKEGVVKYYFSSQLKVDAKLFDGHKAFNWYEFISRSNALPLKFVIDNPQFVLESIAVEIKPMALDDKLFELPAGSKLEKSPF
jgi:hypothetical protein